jgi:hypothetical protein
MSKSVTYLVDELGDELLRVLVRSVHVVASGDDERQAEGAIVRLGNELGTRLGGGVGVGGLHDLLLVHGVLVEPLLAVTIDWEIITIGEIEGRKEGRKRRRRRQ